MVMTLQEIREALDNVKNRNDLSKDLTEDKILFIRLSLMHSIAFSLEHIAFRLDKKLN